MRFQVPQFTEHEAKIAGPLTFKQFILMGAAAGVIMLIYLTLAKSSFAGFIIASVAIVGSALALAFLNIGGRSLPTVMGHFFSFFVGPKIYLWRKKELPPRIIWKKTEEKKDKNEPPTSGLRIAQKSRLSRAAINIETKPR